MIKARERLLEKGARLLLVKGDQGSSIASVYKITEKKLEVSGKKKRVKNYKTRKKKMENTVARDQTRVTPLDRQECLQPYFNFLHKRFGYFIYDLSF